MKDLEKLWALQELELEKRNVEKSAGIHEESKALRLRMDEYKKQADSMKHRVETYKGKKVRLEDLVETRKRILQQIEEEEARLYRGEENNSKVLHALQDEIQMLNEKKDGLTQPIQTLENQCKEQHHKIFMWSKRAEKEKDEILSMKKKWTRGQKQTAEKVEEIEKRINALRKTIDKDTLLQYDRMKEQRMPVIVESQNGICKGCNMQASMILSHSISQGSIRNTFVCENCGRIIYVREQSKE